ncbi:hypothetical protein Tco_0466518 [Tanacetum coccineum]
MQLINVCFADDLFIFARGDVESSRVIMDSFKEFKLTSGLIPSIPKSTAYFCNVLNHTKAAILRIVRFLLKKQRIGSGIGKTSLYRLREDFSYLKRGKAKIAWEDICLPKSEGGLGLRNLELRGRTIWDVPVKDEMSWSWRKLLQLQDIMRPFLWVKLGNSNSTSLWYDNWCYSSPLINYLTSRDISREGFLLTNTVAHLVSNETWSWPQSWLLKAPDLGLITCPALVSLVAHLWQWRDRNGNISSFSVAKAWEAIRSRVMRHGLKTHDKMRQWDVGGDTDLNLLRCVLCDNCPDSHTHLFFECTFSEKVWSYVRDLAGMDLIPPVLQDIILYLLPMGNKRTAKSVFGKLILAASAYFIWMEQNNKTFKNTRRTPEEICDLIMVTVRLKLISFQFKNTTVVRQLLER